MSEPGAPGTEASMDAKRPVALLALAVEIATGSAACGEDDQSTDTPSVGGDSGDTVPTDDPESTDEEPDTGDY